ncbi:hypothetical protein HER15_15095 [Tenacibaculum mesophilum]|uniref:Lipoprotein n=1 Tax=Tenacibaculum mesophilum TaxID=104268 RepID=A0AAE9MR31_9FLAO|nr:MULTISPECIES: hypothetical protein [Tenacibaculum]KAF9660304.1 hypothetical protein HBA12_08735 [Tenacibaculum mesophilum]MCO7186036.1 hypothetical protein [Tenacibaculum sp. XPcli2-G]UTD16728.1 hypothetical protein HER15_15095 [Tenacibaculum mesophilum]
MKQNILKVGTVMGLLLLIGVFSSCDNTKNDNKNQEQGNIATTEETIEKLAVEYRKPIVFITGNDKGNSHFYDSARVYFKEKNYEIINGKYSVEEIISWMNNNTTENPYGEVHIVNNNNPFRAMNLETVVNGDKVTAETLQKTITKGALPSVKSEAITDDTRIIFHTNQLAENTDLINTLKSAFITENKIPQVVASPYYNVFGGEFSNHYLAQPYYVFYPTANSPGKVDLSKEIAKKYPEEKEIAWYDALNNERERYVGEPYTIQYTIPVNLELDYHNSDNEIPHFVMQEEIMDFIASEEALMKEVEKTNIPVEKFRWTYTVKNSQLIIKGKSSALCVLKPLTKPYGELEHVKPDTNNKRLYAMK